MNTLKIEQRDPAELRGHIHPELKSVPELAEDSLEFLAIAAGVGKTGMTEPLKLDADGRIIDDHSRTLLRCALRWQKKTVPTVTLAEANVPLLIICGLAHRRQLTKSAIAYLAAPLLNHAFAAARERHLENLRKGLISPSSAEATTVKTVDELAQEIGVDRSVLFEARKVHELLLDKKTYTFNVSGGAADGETVECTLKQWFEPRILRAPIGGEHEQNRPLGLGGVIAGIASVREGNKDAFNPKHASQLDLFDSGWNAFAGRALKLSPDKMRATLRDWFDKNAENYSEEQLDQIADLGETIKTQAKALKKKTA